MNEFIKKVNEHRTIREFTDEKVSEEILHTLFESLMRTATSNGLQQATIIRVTDPVKKEQISKVSNQEYVARATELLIFIADSFRNDRLVKDNGENIEKESDVDMFFQGFTDASLLAQNATNIIESLGLGAVYLGSILNDAEEIIKILELPELTFPVVGIGFGHPNQDPQLKPRMDVEFRVFENSYKKFDNYKDALKGYDEEMTTYYDLRESNRRVETFSNQVINKLKNPTARRAELIEMAKKNGYKL